VVNEEVDAIRTLGLDPMEVLVVPRVLGLTFTMPFITFWANVAASRGRHHVLGVARHHLAQLPEPAPKRRVDLEFLPGHHKTPFFAVCIALIGCNQGLSVSRSAESVGRRTTQSVVHSIFLVILLDAASRSSSTSSASDAGAMPASLRTSGAKQPILSVRKLATRIGNRVLLRDASFDLQPGEILGVVGASGSGKSVLLRTIVGLLPLAAGTIEVFGEDFGA